jgi:hypothetical protein
MNIFFISLVYESFGYSNLKRPLLIPTQHISCDEVCLISMFDYKQILFSAMDLCLTIFKTSMRERERKNNVPLSQSDSSASLAIASSKDCSCSYNFSQ